LMVRTLATSSQTNESLIEQFLKDHDISVKGKKVPPPILNFEDGLIPENILKHVLSQFDKPTPIQSQALPIAMEGGNMVGIGQTGSGKTLAFLLPAFSHIQKMRRERKRTYRDEGPVALVLTPTRELAIQIMEVAELYRRSTGVRNVCCIGGDSRIRQLRRYDQGPELMIATPGRLRDFLQSKEMTIRDVEYVVLDEADRMLDMGFEPQIRGIMEEIKRERQILMFSATWPKDVKELAEDFLGEYTFLNIGSIELSANKNIKQEILVCQSESRHEMFLEKLESIQDSKILVFAERKATVDRLERIIRKRGLAANGIHGDKSQADRSRVIQRFKNGSVNIMIATDVAARGLDISNVEYVINYDFPNDIENYVHRIGRTGRADKKGTSITFLSQDDASQAGKLIKILEQAEQEVPQELVQLSRLAKESKQEQRRYGNFSGSKPFRRHYDSSSRSSHRFVRDRYDDRFTGNRAARNFNSDYDDDYEHGRPSSRYNKRSSWREDEF